MTAWRKLVAAAWFRRSVRTFLQAFLALLVPGALGWLNGLTAWARNEGQSPFPDAHSLAYLGVTAITAGVIAVVTALWNGTEDGIGHGFLRTVQPASKPAEHGRVSLLLATLVIVFGGIAGVVATSSSAQAAGWTNNGCKVIDGSAQNDARVCLDFYTLQSGGQYLVTSARICLSSSIGSNKDLYGPTVVSIQSSNGSSLGSANLPDTPRNGCSSAAMNVRGGSGMRGMAYSYLDVNPYPPFGARNIYFTMCRLVTSSGGC